MSERRWYCMNCNADLGPAVGKHLQKCPECGSRNAYAKYADLVYCWQCAKASEGKYFDGTPALVCTRFSTFNHVTEPGGFCAWGEMK